MSHPIFEYNMIAMYGNEGKKWFESLPSIIESLSNKHHWTDLTPFDNLTYNYVAHGALGNTNIVLKISLDTIALKRQKRVLEAFQNHLSIKLLYSEPGLLLMERALPGFSLKTTFPEQDNFAITQCCKCIESLQKCFSTPDSLPGIPFLKDWLSKLDLRDENRVLIGMPLDDKASIDYSNQHRALANKAFVLSRRLLAQDRPIKLLHGDLHHDNIVLHGSEWIAIDPQGVWGPMEYEVAAFLMNPIPEMMRITTAEEMKTLIATRIATFANNLHLSVDLITQYAFVKSVLCATWSVEDKSDPSEFLTLATIFESLIVNTS